MNFSWSWTFFMVLQAGNFNFMKIWTGFSVYETETIYGSCKVSYKSFGSIEKLKFFQQAFH